ncbi:MAG: GAF domain-containing protein [Magnetococcales bacterium]|nr:GAF domain-containing protein [Magnetococcales bacterium]MBF0322780.1 GAF domain-containing protein [Magnetococcales bacterium]
MSEISSTLLRQLDMSTDLDLLLGRVLKFSLEISSADRGSILVLDESGSVKHQILARPGQTPEFATYSVLKVMKDGLGGWVYTNHQPALLRDVTKDPRWVILPQDQWETGSAMAVPFFFQERISAMVIVQHEAKEAFDASHLEHLQKVAEHTAHTIEKARLIRKASAENKALYTLLEKTPQPLLIVDEMHRITFLNQAALPYFTSNPTGCDMQVFPEGSGLLQAIRLFRSEEVTPQQLKVRTSWPTRESLKMSVRELSPLGLVLTFLE